MQDLVRAARTRAAVPRSWRRVRAAAVGAAIALTVTACPPEEPTPSTNVNVQASSATIAYGDAVPAVTATYSGNTTPTTPATCTTTATSTSAPGTYPTTCSGAALLGKTFVYHAGSITITKAPLSITASGGSATYGGTVPAITAAYGGLKNGETGPAVLPVCSTTATSSSDVGDYPSTCAGAADANYAITVVDGTVTIDPAEVTVDASSAVTAYGDATPTISATYAGFVNGDTAPATPATCSTPVLPTTGVGTYASSCADAADPNYTFTYTDGTVTVGTALASVIASSDSVSYGYPVPPVTASYSGLVNGETAPATPPTCSTTATSSSPVGSYPSSCVGAADPNYTFAYVDGTVDITVGAAPVTVTATSATIDYGDAVPVGAPDYAGFTGGQTEPATTLATCNTTATPTSPPGLYPVVCSGAADPNYSFAYVDGTITILPAAATVTAGSATATYGDAIPAITASYGGLRNGATAPAVEPTCGTTATDGSPVGSYDTACLGASDANYTFTYVPGSLEITRAAATVTASSVTSVYGASVPAVTATYGGLVGGQTEPATPATCSSTSTSSSGVGSYVTTCTGADDPNYTFTSTDGTAEVTAAEAVITASSATIVEGDDAPEITASYSGLVNGDTAAATPPTCSTTADASSTAGDYPATCSGAADPNYTFTYVDGVVTVDEFVPPAVEVEVTASSITFAAGETVPTVTATYDGLTDGDTAPTTPATCTTTAVSYSPAGSYTTSCSGAADPKYTFIYTNGVATVQASGFGAYKANVHTTTIAAGSNGANLPQATINVAGASSAGFAGTGYNNLVVVTSNGPQSVFCTSIQASSFGGCSGGTGTMSTGNFVSDAAPHVFDVYTVVPGGKTAVQPSSLTVVQDVPAAQRGTGTTVTATANNGLLSYVQSAAPTGTFSLTFGICSTGTATYSAGDPNCFTRKVFYAPSVAANMGAAVTVSLVTSNQYQNIHVGTSAPSSVTPGRTFTSYLASAGSAIPSRQPSAIGDATVNYSTTFTSIYPIPAGQTFVSAALVGGDARTAGVATVAYCTAAGTGCTAKFTGNYNDTTYPYVQVTLPTAVQVPAGAFINMPTLALTTQATGATGTTGALSLTEYINVTRVTAPIVGGQTATFDGYPTTGSNTSVTPPNGTKITLWSTAIS